jgi:hypothetical protein
MQNLILYTFLSIESVAFITVLIVLPVHIYTIKKREKIVRLVVTFDQEKLN